MDKSHMHTIGYKTPDVTEYPLQGPSCIKCQTKQTVVHLMWAGRDGGDRGSRWRERSLAILTILAEFQGFRARSELMHQKVTCYLKSHFGVAIEAELLTPVYQASTGP